MSLLRHAFGCPPQPVTIRGAALGDVVCTQSDRTAAGAAMQRLANMMNAAPAAVQASYKPQVNAVLSTWNQIETEFQGSTLAKWNPFVSCNYKTLAQQGDAIAAALAQATNQAAPVVTQLPGAPPPPPVMAPPVALPGVAPTPPMLPGGLDATIAKVATVGAVALAAAIVLPAIVDSTRRRRQ